MSDGFGDRCRKTRKVNDDPKFSSLHNHRDGTQPLTEIGKSKAGYEGKVSLKSLWGVYQAAENAGMELVKGPRLEA